METKKRWIPSKYPGVRYRQHPTRKHGVAFDRYFAIRYKRNGVSQEEGLGWSSEGWTVEKAAQELAELKKAARTGQGATSLREKRLLEESRKEAEALAEQQAETDNLTLTEFFTETYYPQAQADKRKGSWRTEELLFRTWLKPSIGHKTFREVAPFDLEAIKSRMAKAGKAPRTIHYALALVRQIFNRAKALDVFTGDNPVSRIKKPTSDNRRTRFLSHEEAAALLRALEERSQQAHDVALMSLHCGLRAGEIFNLTWGAVDFERNQLLVMDGKHTMGGKNRTAFMTGPVRAMLEARANEQAPTDYIFPSRKGGRATDVSDVYERTVEALGLNAGVTDPRHKVVFHTLRHTYASWLVEAGVDLFTVKTLLGHSTIAMSERYAHLGNNTLRQAVRAFENGMGKKTHVLSIGARDNG